MRLIATLFWTLGLTGVGSGADAWSAPRNYEPSRLKSTERPAELKDVGITERLGEAVSVGELEFIDESGAEVVLGDYFKDGKPVILTLVYYSCPSLCNFVLNGFLESLKDMQWTAGEQFEIVTVSIDPREGPEVAARKKANYLESYGRDGAGEGWHFLTGREDQIKKLASEVGFGYRYVKKQNEYAHGAAIFVLTPEGRVSRYLYGIDYPERDLRLSLLEASDGKIGTVADKVLMFCFQYDPDSRGYSLYVFRLVQVGGLGTIAIFGGYLFAFWRRQRRPKDRSGGDGAHPGESS